MAKIKDVKELRLEDLEIGRGQVRVRDVGKDIQELADSIAKVGLLEPIVVSPSETPGRYEIITGQRRFLAHQELKRPMIMAAILDASIDETTAKVLSITENMVRRDLHSRDLIDACTSLYKKYGSIKAVVEETGLPYNKVSQYVKYDQLVPELKKLVDKGEVKVATAIRAQRAASVSGEVNPAEAIELAKEMTPMSGAQQTKIVKDREDNPDLPADQVIESAKTGGRITSIQITLSSNAHTSLKKYADVEDTNIDDAARMLIEEGLTEKGFTEE